MVSDTGGKVSPKNILKEAMYRISQEHRLLIESAHIWWTDECEPENRKIKRIDISVILLDDQERK